MSSRKKSKQLKSPCKLKQLDICSSMKKLQERSIKNKQLSKIIETGIIIDLVSSDDSETEKKQKVENVKKLVKRKLFESETTTKDYTKKRCNQSIGSCKGNNIKCETIYHSEEANKDEELNKNNDTQKDVHIMVNTFSPGDNNTFILDTSTISTINANEDNKQSPLKTIISQKSLKNSTSKQLQLNITTPRNSPQKSSHPQESPQKNISLQQFLEKSKTPQHSPRKQEMELTPWLPNKKDISTISNQDGDKKKRKGVNPYFLELNNKLITSALRDHSHILEQDDINLFTNIQKAEASFQYVCFKLYKYKPIWYRLSNFVKKIQLELQDEEIVRLYRFLMEHNIAETDYIKEDLESLLNMLKVDEIKKICAALRITQRNPKGANSEQSNKKQQLINALLDQPKKQQTLYKSISGIDLIKNQVCKVFGEHVIKLNSVFQNAFYRIFVLETFTNPSLYNLDDFLRIKLDPDITFPEFKIQKYEVFYNSAEFKDYVEARSFRDELELPCNHLRRLHIGETVFENLQEISKTKEDDERYREAPHLKRFSATSVYINVLSKISSALVIRYPKVVKTWLKYLLKTFPQSHRIGDWYFELSRSYRTQKKTHKLVDTITEAFTDKTRFTEFQLENLASLGINLSQTLGMQYDKFLDLLPPPLEESDFRNISIRHQTLRDNSSGRKRDYVKVDSDGGRIYLKVEEVALDYYKEELGYSDGCHCEGSIIMTCFALLFWDIIYNPQKEISGTFLSYNQFYPLDFNTPYFYINRKDEIDQRLKDIADNWTDEELFTFAESNWTSHANKMSFTSFSIIHSITLLENIITCIGRQIFSKILERLVKDIRQYRSGMPDLLVWNTHLQKAIFVEVKGENDRLSIKQKMWLRFLNSIGALAEVCYVHSIGSKIKDTSKKSTSKNTIAKTPRKRQARNETIKTQELEASQCSSDDFE